MNVVTEVVKNDLCISCRACAQICPINIIKFTHSNGLFYPTIDNKKCINCGLCTKVCPSFKNDLAEYSQNDIYKGQYKVCYTAYSNDNTIRYNGSSGGMITNLITTLILKGYYNKVAVVLYDKYKGSQAEYTITDNIDDIRAAAKSKYVPVSTTNVLEHIERNSADSLIVVGTSCQIYAIKSFCKLKKIDDSNILFLGLFCEHTLNYNIYNYYTEIYGDYDAMYFRSKYKNGWPGHTVLSKKGVYEIIDRNVRMALKPIFKNNRCRYCFDKLNNHADISFGDCYINGEQSKEGKSSLIIRTKKGESAFSLMDGLITSDLVSIDYIEESQHIATKDTNYARAVLSQNNMYINIPFQPDSSLLKTRIEKNEYKLLRIGAIAQGRKDYLNIKKIITNKSISQYVNRYIIRYVKYLYNKLMS